MKKMKTPIRVGIVDDDKSIRDWVRNALEGSEGFEFVAEFGSAEELLDSASSMELDVLLLDIQLDGMNGVSCLRELRPLLTNPRIAIFTAYPDEEPIFQSLRAGADGYLIKNLPPSRLRAAIGDLYRGESPITPSIARRILDYFLGSGSAPSDIDKLSPREKEVMEQMAKGLIYKEIASVLGISMETVRTHLHNVYRKLKVKSGTEAVMKLFGRDVRPCIAKAPTRPGSRR